MSVTVAIPPLSTGTRAPAGQFTRQSRSSRPSPELQSALSQLDIDECSKRELSTPILDELFECLWLMAKKAATHIDPLHRQIIKEREITVTEDPKLHLVWYYKRVFLKSIPPCLLNHDFWKIYLSPQSQNGSLVKQDNKFTAPDLSEPCLLALGFLRSYSHLIAHESNFHLATAAHLLPSSLSYAQFDRFIDPFCRLDNTIVAKRYQFGQFRLTRLNYATRLFPTQIHWPFLPWNYEGTYWQTGQFLQDLGAPLLFLFVAFSLILSAMQVVLAALGTSTWAAFARVTLGSSVATIVLIAAVGAATVFDVFAWWSNQMLFAFNLRRGDRAARAKDPT